MTTAIHIRPAAAVEHAASLQSWRGDRAFDEAGRAEAGARTTWR